MDVFLLHAALIVCKIFLILLLFKLISIVAYIIVKVGVAVFCIFMLIYILKSILR